MDAFESRKKSDHFHLISDRSDLFHVLILISIDGFVFSGKPWRSAAKTHNPSEGDWLSHGNLCDLVYIQEYLVFEYAGTFGLCVSVLKICSDIYMYNICGVELNIIY